LVHLTKEEYEKKAIEEGKMIVHEDEESNKVSFAVYKHYFLRYYGTNFFICISVILILIFSSRLTLDYLIGHWSNLDPDE